MGDAQYWKEIDKAASYPPERKAKAEAAALKAFKVREKKTKIAERKAKAKQVVEARKAKKAPRKRKNAKKTIKKARTVTQAFKRILG